MSKPDTALLSIQDLRFRWPKTKTDCLAIDHFELQTGETTFLRGPSGCGKSTLLSLVAGVLTANLGSVRLLGQDWQRLSPSARDPFRADHVGYIFQQFNLLPYLSAIDNVVLACRFSRRRTSHAGNVLKTAQGLLEQVGLRATDWNRPASELSVGQQQRVAAARALIGRPDLVIADEPTSALDQTLRDAFIDVLLQSCAEAGSALLFVSHDAQLANRFQHQIDLTLLNQAMSPLEVAS